MKKVKNTIVKSANGKNVEFQFVQPIKTKVNGETMETEILLDLAPIQVKSESANEVAVSYTKMILQGMSQINMDSKLDNGFSFKKGFKIRAKFQGCNKWGTTKTESMFGTQSEVKDFLSFSKNPDNAKAQKFNKKRYTNIANNLARAISNASSLAGLQMQYTTETSEAVFNTIKTLKAIGTAK